MIKQKLSSAAHITEINKIALQKTRAIVTRVFVIFVLSLNHFQIAKLKAV